MSSKSRFYLDIMALHPEVTGSCFLCVLKLPNGVTEKFMVDCGLFQEQDYNTLNDTLPVPVDDIKAIFLTHAHVDHIGRLPLAIHNGYSNPIYCTNITKDICNTALVNCYEILKSDFNHQKKMYPGIKMLYDNEDVSQALHLIKGLNLNQTISVSDYLSVTFLGNGHIVGSSCILFQAKYPGYEDINILFTGDYKKENLFVKESPIPKWVSELELTIVQESTYGDTLTSEVKESFYMQIPYILWQKKSIFIPVIALERAETILYHLKQLQDINSIDKSIPIYLDGNLAISYLNKFHRYTSLDFIPSNFHIITDETRENVIRSGVQQIILSTSGMADHGPAPVYLQSILEKENYTVFFTSYTPEYTLGGKLKELNYGDEIEISGSLLYRRCDIEQTTEFSSHAKADELLDFLKGFKNLKCLLINHGEIESKRVYSEYVSNNMKIKNIQIIDRYTIMRVDHYGFVKSMSSKFSPPIDKQKKKEYFEKEARKKAKSKQKGKTSRKKVLPYLWC